MCLSVVLTYTVLCLCDCRSMKAAGMMQERGTESVKQFCPTETVTRDSMRTAKDTER